MNLPNQCSPFRIGPPPGITAPSIRKPFSHRGFLSEEDNRPRHWREGPLLAISMKHQIGRKVSDEKTMKKNHYQNILGFSSPAAGPPIPTGYPPSRKCDASGLGLSSAGVFHTFRIPGSQVLHLSPWPWRRYCRTTLFLTKATAKMVLSCVLLNNPLPRGGPDAEALCPCQCWP